MGLSRNEFLVFTAGDEITTADLVLKHCSSSTELVSGRQLFGMAERGMRDYRKALAFTKDKWDVKRCRWNRVRLLKMSSNTFVVECIYTPMFKLRMTTMIIMIKTTTTM